MVSRDPELQKLFIETPCIRSRTLSRIAGCNIFLKLENLQPSGSFKSRGVGTMMHQAMRARPGRSVHFYCSSGGNAGLACATAAATLGQPCTIVVPTLTTPFMIEKIKLLGAQVHQVGSNWAHADAHLRAALLARDPGGVYVPPFDHPDLWAGASTLVDELAAQLAALGVARLDGVVCNCGGGGLLNGVMDGVRRHFGGGGGGGEGGKGDKRGEGEERGDEREEGGNEGGEGKEPLVLAVETIGADSLHQSVAAGELVTLPAITSIATSLGAPRVSERTWRWAREAAGQLKSAVVTDAEAAVASVRFADDERMLVEAACGATISTVYNGDLRRYIGGGGEKGISDEEWRAKNVVVVVCGGANVSAEILRGYEERYGGEVKW
ncbi:tryptophan synthase beta subunit-like PLP-dependent enzyme [Daldinia caldariorum]|uniref:tryptophan synthase beta subunit-like PLP-dependent enzyme n=1 Tax=Daldinia caldariorum TaxID=326644 RepID=UPI002008879D|nr:tryptophan synthase beta subunit-like PLP-dependent enzyme [Daldinia caldariorum]KAI1469735.1 tryptophan synthase beta subunit-like PLP-dependent enzyme [Daldinia caldariorum]